MDPNAGKLPDLDEFLAALDRLGEEELLSLAAAWRAVDKQAHEDAWTRAVAAAAVTGSGRRMEEARQAALDWATKGTNVPWPYGRMDDMWLQIRREAAPALADAAVAIALGNSLDREASDLLLGPWRATSDQA